MSDLFHKLVYYYLTGDKEVKLDIDKNKKDEYKNTIKLAKSYVDSLKQATNNLGYKTTFDSFIDLLEDYIATKDKMSDKVKRDYLRVLACLSDIFNVNLKEELTNYVTVIESDESISEKLFVKFASYYLNSKSSPKDLKELRELSNKYVVNFDEASSNIIKYLEGVKAIAKEVNVDLDNDSFDSILDYYLDNKKAMDDNTKIKYLKILSLLSHVYKVDLYKKIKEYSR